MKGASYSKGSGGECGRKGDFVRLFFFLTAAEIKLQSFNGKKSHFSFFFLFFFWEEGEDGREEGKKKKLSDCQISSGSPLECRVLQSNYKTAVMENW